MPARSRLFAIVISALVSGSAADANAQRTSAAAAAPGSIHGESPWVSRWWVAAGIGGGEAPSFDGNGIALAGEIGLARGSVAAILAKSYASAWPGSRRSALSGMFGPSIPMGPLSVHAAAGIGYLTGLDQHGESGPSEDVRGKAAAAFTVGLDITALRAIGAQVRYGRIGELRVLSVGLLIGWLTIEERR